jgi:hypothetical protein
MKYRTMAFLGELISQMSNYQTTTRQKIKEYNA